jgi:hypothetical protein
MQISHHTLASLGVSYQLHVCNDTVGYSEVTYLGPLDNIG